MESLLLEKIGLFSNKISIDDLRPGDHIYSWRNAYIYSHHGIYIGDGKVIHFTRGGGLETGTGTFLDNFIVSSVPNHREGDNNSCPNCGQQSQSQSNHLNGVITSCLDCFLSGGNICLFEYNVSPAVFISKLRGGTCTTAKSDTSEEVVARAKRLLMMRNGFGEYHALENNCEDFAMYCKTSLVVGKSYVLGRSGQANAVSVGACVARMVSPWASNAIRLFSDIGMRNDAVKVNVDTLVDRFKCD